MGLFGMERYRILVVLLLLLIIWQVYKLYPDNAENAENAQNAEINKILFPNKIIEVSVFYEALCPDSRHFFIHHLENANAKLKDNLSIKLIPYGKAQTYLGQKGELKFECQHGEVECRANKIHACVIEAIHDITEQIAFVNCMIIDNIDPDQALRRCGSSLSMDVAPVIECADGEYGANLLKKHGESTRIVKPTFIPTVLLDGSKDNQAGLLKNFILEVCDKFKNYKIPQACT